MLNDSLFISWSQFVTIPEKSFEVSFCEEKQSETVQSYFYQRYTPNTKISGICRWVFSYKVL